MRVAIMLAPELEAARMREALRGACVALDRDYAGLVAAKDAIRRLQGEVEALREGLAGLVRLAPCLGRANHGAYTEHAMLCDVERGIGPCDCGLAEWEAAVERARALAGAP